MEGERGQKTKAKGTMDRKRESERKGVRGAFFHFVFLSSKNGGWPSRAFLRFLVISGVNLKDMFIYGVMEKIKN